MHRDTKDAQDPDTSKTCLRHIRLATSESKTVSETVSKTHACGGHSGRMTGWVRWAGMTVCGMECDL